MFLGTPADDPFNLADVDFSLMTKLEQAAKDKLGIADGAVQRIVISKSHRENGGAIEWEVEVRSTSAPLFWMPGQPPLQEGSVTFNAKGELLHAKYPPGRGPQTHLLAPPDLQKAIDQIWERIERDLDAQGYATTGSVLRAAECAELIALYPDRDRFRSSLSRSSRRRKTGNWRSGRPKALTSKFPAFLAGHLG